MTYRLKQVLRLCHLGVNYVSLFPDDENVDALLEHLLANPEEIFGDQAGTCIEENEGGEYSLIIEEQRVVSYLKATKADVLLLWATSFTVSNQKTRRKRKNPGLLRFASAGKGRGHGEHGLVMKLTMMIEWKGRRRRSSFREVLALLAALRCQL